MNNHMIWILGGNKDLNMLPESLYGHFVIL